MTRTPPGYPSGKGPSFSPMGGPMRGPMTPSSTGSGTPMVVDPDVKSRFEFVLLFVWKEPTPSEKPLIAETPADPNAPTK